MYMSLFRTRQSSHDKEDKIVVRLSTTYWHDIHGAYLKKSLRVLRRKSFGYNHLLEDCSAVGACDALNRIIGIDSLPDGIYEVVICNESRDYETGDLCDWDLKLVPVEVLSKG